MKNIYLFILSLFCAYTSFAQTSAIKGKVVDAGNQKPIHNASVTSQDKQNSITNKEGEFSIN
ncbi:MAG: carboxypeptidase-like regulatory domain-containing protein, partial [Bacteroidia bacterium]|nr:carboxypeptidase-like regulatory domain-containing protein [Bacteroidia bacterium]